MKSILTFILLIASTFGFSQKIKLKVEGQADTTVHLVKYNGAKLYYADTALIKKGIVEFDGKKQQAGLMGLLLPGQKLVEFVYTNEDVDIETKGPDYASNMKVKKSEENKIFVEYIRFMTAKRAEAQKVQTDMAALKKEDDKYKELEAMMKKINAEVLSFQNEQAAKYSNLFVGKMIRMSIEVDIPEAPKGMKEKEAGDYRYYYYRDHFFDNFDFTNDGLVNTPIFGNKIEYYFSNKMLMQHWDTILKYAYNLIDNRIVNQKSKAFEYVVSYVTSTFGKSNQMGMDKVYTWMADKYYCSKNSEGKSPAHWMDEEKLKELCEKISVQKHLVMGEKAPNIILPDTLDKPWYQLNWINMHKLPAEYTVLYFWDSDCGHCKKVTPKLATLYDKKLKGRNVEVVAIGKATEGSYKKWKEYIKENHLNFINVAITEEVMKVAKNEAYKLIPLFTTIESLNVHSTYDIFSTPRVFVLDKDKKFIAKQLSISQLEDLLDRLQGKEKEPKLFPPDAEEDEHMQSKD